MFPRPVRVESRSTDRLKRFVRGGLRVAVLLAVLASTVDDARAQRLHLRDFGVAEGLPSPEVRDIAQGADGRLWLATGAGLAAFDGREMAVYGLEAGLDWAGQGAVASSDGDSSNGSSSAESWSSGARRWWSVAATAPFPIYGLDPGDDPGDASRWRAVTDAGAVDPEGGLTDFAVLPGDDGPTAEAPTFLLATDRGLLLGTPTSDRSHAWRRVEPLRGEPADRSIHDLHRWGPELLVASGEGVAVLDRGSLVPRPALVPPAAPSRGVHGLAGGAVDGVGLRPDALWLVGDGWLGRAADPRAEAELLLVDARIEPGPDGRVAATADGLGGVVFACGSAVCAYRPERGLEVLGRERGIDVGARIDALFVDREGSLWIGGSDGLQQLVSRRFTTWDLGAGLFDEEVTAAVERRDGTIVLGHRGGLSFVRDGRVVDTRGLPLTAADLRRLEPVRDLLEDRRGVLWAALDTQGLLRLDGDAVRRFGADEGLEAPATSLAATSDGRLWIGTERGLWRLERDRVVPVDGGPRPLKIRTLRADGDALWLASADGVHRLDDDGTWSSWRCGRPDCDSTFGVLPGPSRTLVGTAAGLYAIDPDASGATLAPSSEPPFDRPVFLLLAEPRKAAGGPRLWLGTSGGVVTWSAAAGPRLYRVEDGLAGREVNRSAALVDRRGRIWIGTDQGATVYDSLFDAGPPPAPRLELLSARVDDARHDSEALPLDRRHRLSAGADVVFAFRAVSLRDPERARLEARLEPFDDDWIEIDRTEVRYTNLPPGTYTFAVRGASRHGGWSDEVSSAPLVVAQPLVRRPWFYGLLGAALVLAAVLAQDLGRRLRRSRSLEDEVDRRLSELKASEDRYRKTFRSIDDGVVTTDADGRIELLNPRAQVITGWSADEAAGRLLDDVLTLTRRGSGVQKADPQRLSILRGGDPKDSIGPVIHAVLTTRDEVAKHVELTTSPIFGSGRMIGLVVVLRDVSRRRELEEELARAQKLEAVGLLAGGIAHDFNNLLTVLLGNISLVRDAEGLDADDRRSLEDAETALVRARDLTQQLLTFSRGGAPVREAASIADVVRDSAGFVLRGSNVRCDLDLADDLWVVEIDAGQISQVMNNLLINAVQAMPSGGVIRVVGRNLEPGSSEDGTSEDALGGGFDGVDAPLAPGRYVAIDVIDQGVGIPDDLLGRVFDPYFSTKQEGRGLGLASAYSIVKRHDGLLTVRSRGAGGTTFRIYLPASAAERPSPAPDETTPSASPDARVLLMDDDAAVRQTTASMLRRLGCTVTEARDGREAIELYAEALRDGRRFHLVLTDLTVPGGMGGQAAVQRLLEIDPEVVAVVYSGYSTDPVLAHHEEHGFRGRLSKPFSLADLSTVVADALASAPAANAR